MKKGVYYSQKHKKEIEVEIVRDSKRYYWVSLFNSIQRKKKNLGNYPLTTSKSQGIVELNSYKDSM